MNAFMVTGPKYSKCFFILVACMLLFIVILSINSNFCLNNFKFRQKTMTVLIERRINTRFSSEDLKKKEAVKNKEISNGFTTTKYLKKFENLSVGTDSTISTTTKTTEKPVTIETTTTEIKTTTKHPTLTTTNKQITSKITTTAESKRYTTNGLATVPDASTQRKINRLLHLLEPKKKQCEPVDNVIFLKTHKTGSSTLINIFQRYIINNNKTIALPSNHNLLGWPDTFQEDFILNHTKGKKYNIICNHARFQKERMLNVMSSNKTKIVTILRDPLSQFQSTVVYLHFESLFGLKKHKNESILEQILNMTYSDRIRKIRKSSSRIKYLAVNQNAYDMGFPTIRRKPKIKDVLQKVNEDFDLIMISNFMSESLILLKNLLCWDLMDIVYFTLNKRPSKYRQKVKNIDKTRQDVYEWNDIDAALFNKFNKTLWSTINSKGKKFNEELNDLHEANQLLKELCLQDTYSLDKSQPWFPILGLKLKPNLTYLPFKELCKNMVKSEIVFDNELKKRFLNN